MVSSEFKVSVPFNPQGVAILRAMANGLEAATKGPQAGVTAPAANPAPAPTVAATAPAHGHGKRGRPSNAQKAAKEEEVTAAASDGMDFGVGDELGLDQQDFDLNKDVIPAFQGFIKSRGGDTAEAGKILLKFGVNSVQKLPKEKYGEVMAALGAN